MEHSTQGNTTGATVVYLDKDMENVQVLAKSFMMYKVGE